MERSPTSYDSLGDTYTHSVCVSAVVTTWKCDCNEVVLERSWSVIG